MGEANEAAEILRSARELLATKGWTQDFYSRDEQVNPVNWMSDRAYKFCALGAVYRSVGREFGTDVRAALSVLSLSISSHNTAGIAGITDFNDAPGRTREEVLAAFDRAIALASGDHP